MTVWMIAGISVTAAIAALVLRQTQPAFSLVMTIAAGTLLLVSAVSAGVPLIERIMALFEKTAVSGAYIDVLIKALGIGLLTQTAADVCRDAGETALAGKTEFAGKVLLLLCGLPLFEYAASLLESIISGQAVMP